MEELEEGGCRGLLTPAEEVGAVEDVKTERDLLFLPLLTAQLIVIVA